MNGVVEKLPLVFSSVDYKTASGEENRWGGWWVLE